ncbi:MAG: RNA polymerase sigma factor [Deltaproteobacteria bacterium]|nr:RNA polymerase sigma factor [Deltaproteobacteria bacterium]
MPNSTFLLPLPVLPSATFYFTAATLGVAYMTDATTSLASGTRSSQKSEEHTLRVLFDAARGGDGAASDALCRKMRPRLYRVAFVYVKNAAEADDIAQDALIRTLTKTFLFLGRGSVTGWMIRITQNLAKNRLRDRKRRREILDDASGVELSERGALATSLPQPDDLLEQEQERLLLEKAFSVLSPRQEEVLRLRLTAQLSFGEIAETLSMKAANARVTFHQGKEKLLKELKVLSEIGQLDVEPFASSLSKASAKVEEQP